MTEEYCWSCSYYSPSNDGCANIFGLTNLFESCEDYDRLPENELEDRKKLINLIYRKASDKRYDEMRIKRLETLKKEFITELIKVKF